MKKILFDLMTSPLSLLENPIYNYIAMAIIGLVAFKIAFYLVGELGLRGEAGSIVHWIIRIIAFVIIWMLCCVTIKIIIFIAKNWIVVLTSAMLLLILFLLRIYAEKHDNSILNKKIF